MRRLLTASGTAAVMLVIATAATAGTEDPPATAAPVDVVARIVNGIVTADYPSTGALLSSGNPSTAGISCSGTLIGCQTFLTAGHCVEGDLNPSHYTVFLQHAGFFSTSRVALHPDYNPQSLAADVAVVTLANPVNGIRPTPINTTTAPATGLAGTIVGFGRTGGDPNLNSDYAIKHAGSVTTASCKNGVSSTASVCFDFNEPLGTPGTNSDTCEGDSGGPLFIDFGSGPRVAGITSGGNSGTCLPVDNSFDANVFTYRSWIQQQAGADLNNTSCGSLMQVGNAGTNVTAFTGQLGSAAAMATHSFVVTAGTAVLRVTMNGVDNGSDFDLFVKAGSPPSTSSFDCSQNGPGQFGACEFTTPAAGTWFVLVDRAGGSGPYQVTATTFGGGCSDPANAGQSCDDNNPCTTNDRCQASICMGTAAVNGTACDDGNPCTQPDTCQAGTCTSSAAPRTDCRAPFVTPSGLFRLQDSTPGDPEPADKLTWNWWRGSATQTGELGDPLSTTNYELCVYDESAGIPELVMSERITAATTCGTTPCWKATATGFKYTDTNLLNGPISSLALRQGTDGKAKITLKGKGTGLGMPLLPLHEPVTVQLSNGVACWEGHYTDSTSNYSLEFKAKAR